MELMRLRCHRETEQVQPDFMHTGKDVVQHIYDLLMGINLEKVEAAEAKIGSDNRHIGEL